MKRRSIAKKMMVFLMATTMMFSSGVNIFAQEMNTDEVRIHDEAELSSDAVDTTIEVTDEEGNIIESYINTDKGTIKTVSEDTLSEEEEKKLELLDGYSNIVHWNFLNSTNNFATTDGKYNSGYYIKRSDYNRLISNLNKNERAVMSSVFNVDNAAKDKSKLKQWGGSCYGMSSSVVDLMNEYIDIDDLPSKTEQYLTEDTKSGNIDKDVISMINYYMNQQHLSSLTSYEMAYRNITQKEKIIDIINQIESGYVVNLCFKWYNFSSGSHSGHSVVAYAVNDFNSSLTITNPDGSKQSFPINGVIRIYDCSMGYGNANANLYFYIDNTTNESFWGIPAWNICSINNNIEKTIINNGNIAVASGSVGVNNYVDYATGKVNRSIIKAEDDYTVINTSCNNFTALINGKKIVVEDGMISDESDTELVNKVYVRPRYADIEVNYNDTPDEGLKNCDEEIYSLCIPEECENILITSNEDIDYAVLTSDMYQEIITDEPGSISINDAGICMDTRKPADYSIKVSRKTGDNWDYTEITGKDSADIKTTNKEDGVGLFSEDFNDVKIRVVDELDEFSMTADTEAQDVFVTLDEKDNPMILSDEDADGIYEYLINKTFRDKVARPDENSYEFNMSVKDKMFTTSDFVKTKNSGKDFKINIPKESKGLISVNPKGYIKTKNKTGTAHFTITNYGKTYDVVVNIYQPHYKEKTTTMKVGEELIVDYEDCGIYRIFALSDADSKKAELNMFTGKVTAKKKGTIKVIAILETDKKIVKKIKITD